MILCEGCEDELSPDITDDEELEARLCWSCIEEMEGLPE